MDFHLYLSAILRLSMAGAQDKFLMKLVALIHAPNN